MKWHCVPHTKSSFRGFIVFTADFDWHSLDRVNRTGIGVYLFDSRARVSLFRANSYFRFPPDYDLSEPVGRRALSVTDPAFAALCRESPLPEPVVDWLLENLPESERRELDELLIYAGVGVGHSDGG